MHELPDEYLAATLPVAKKIALAIGCENYNILQVCILFHMSFNKAYSRHVQNNGKIAHQEVNHVHFHIIPKPTVSDSEGLVIGWPTKKADMDDLKKLHEELLGKL